MKHLHITLYYLNRKSIRLLGVPFAMSSRTPAWQSLGTGKSPFAALSGAIGIAVPYLVMALICFWLACGRS
jgi:hypothetical protein